MLGQKGAKKICEDVLLRAGSDPAEVLLFLAKQNLTRFANNYIHQNVAETDVSLIVRLLRSKRIGLATTNRLDGDGLDRVIERARANSEVSPEDPDYPGLPKPAAYAAVNAFDQVTAGYSPRERAYAVGKVCRMTKDKGFNGSGLFSTGINEVAIANTEGLLAYHLSSNGDFQVVVAGEDSSGREQGSAWRADDIPVQSLAQLAIQKAEAGRNPRPIDPGPYAVVLSPYATEDLLNMLNYYGMGAQAVLES